MLNLKVKLRRGCASTTRDSVLNVLNSFNVKCSKIHAVDDDLFLIYCNTAHDVDLIFSPECGAKLDELKCVPQVPPGLEAKRSVIVRRLDNQVYSQNVLRIKAEIESKNTGFSLKTVYKFPKSKTLKLTFPNQDMVDRILSHGFVMFSLSISPVNISREEFINIITCFRCYQWNDHTSDKCKKPSSFKICSLCSSDQHTFRECKSVDKKCINCSGNHSTLSFACPRRREIAISLKSAVPPKVSLSSKTNPGPSFASVVSSVVSQPTGGDLGENILKSSMCIIISAMKHRDAAGFHRTMTKLLKLNGLPSFEMGDVEPPCVVNSLTAASDADVSVLLDDDVDSHDETMDDSLNTEEMKSDGGDGEWTKSKKRKRGGSAKKKKRMMVSSEQSVVRNAQDTRNDSPVTAAINKFARLKDPEIMNPQNIIQNKLRFMRTNNK